MLKLCAFCGMFWGVTATLILSYFQATLTQYIVVSSLIYGIAFFASFLMFSLCQVAGQ
jgi:hypothetical protein